MKIQGENRLWSSLLGPKFQSFFLSLILVFSGYQALLTHNQSAVLEQYLTEIQQQAQALSEAARQTQGEIRRELKQDKEAAVLSLQHILNEIQGRALEFQVWRQDWELFKQAHSKAEGALLPFLIQSLDVWNGLPYLQIAMKEDRLKKRELRLWESVAGWKLIEINLAHLSVSFENDAHQVQKIHLHHLNQSEMKG